MAGTPDNPDGVMYRNDDWRRLVKWWSTPVADGGAGCWIEPQMLLNDQMV